jgi:hypothetical protein
MFFLGGEIKTGVENKLNSGGVSAILVYDVVLWKLSAIPRIALQMKAELRDKMR